MSKTGARILSVLVLAASLLLASCAGDGGDSGAGDGGGEPIRLGFTSTFTGRIAALGDTGFKGAQLAVEEINKAGGVLDGRMFEIEWRDDQGNRDTAVQNARQFMLRENVDFLIDGSSSANSFAISQVANQLQVVDLATASEAANLTDDENLHPYVFRLARNTQHDGIAAALYAKDLPYTRWYSVSPDYEYGRSSTDLFFQELQAQKSGVQVLGQAWPKLFEPDYTPAIQQILAARPEAVYSALWGGDLVAFIQQAKQFGLFEQVKFFSPNIADSTVIAALGADLPRGLITGSRWIETYPDTQVNRSFGQAYLERYGELPTNWSVQAYQAIYFLKAAIEKAGSTEADAVAEALAGLELADMPWGDLQLRADDHQLINYAIGYGETTGNPASPVRLDTTIDWAAILKREAARQ